MSTVDSSVFREARDLATNIFLSLAFCRAFNAELFFDFRLV
jgi:hypothetical protein